MGARTNNDTIARKKSHQPMDSQKKEKKKKRYQDKY
jgi:hypothetical protein